MFKKHWSERECGCGSGLLRSGELMDARGIFCGYYCEKCEAKLRAKYRPEIFENPRYWTDEPVDEDGEPDPGNVAEYENPY